MMIKFKTVRSGLSITRVEVVRETDRFVVRKRISGTEYREAKVSEWERYHDTWADARAFLLARAQRQLVAAQTAVTHAGNDLLEIQRMKE